MQKLDPRPEQCQEERQDGAGVPRCYLPPWPRSPLPGRTIALPHAPLASRPHWLPWGRRRCPNMCADHLGALLQCLGRGWGYRCATGKSDVPTLGQGCPFLAVIPTFAGHANLQLCKCGLELQVIIQVSASALGAFTEH